MSEPIRWAADLPTEPGWYRVRTRDAVAGEWGYWCMDIRTGGAQEGLWAFLDQYETPGVDELPGMYPTLEWGGKVDFGEGQG